MKAHNLALLSSIKNADYISTDGITVFAEAKKEEKDMEVHEFESMLIMAGIPMYWFSVLAEDGIFKVRYFDYDTGEEGCDIYRIDGSDIYRKLEYMPFDWNGKHATGWAKWNEDTLGGWWEDQYEEGLI